MRRIKGLALLLSLLLVFSIVSCTSKEKPNEELSLEDIDSQGSEVDEEIVSFSSRNRR